MTCGVYQISISDYYYFGSSGDCEKRCGDHFKSLKRGNHNNQKMQDVFNKHKTFDWHIAEDCDDRDMAYAVEQRYIDVNFGRQHCLNLNADAVKPPSTKGKPVSVETRQRMSAAHKGKKFTISEEAKQRRRESPQLHTEETKQLISEKLTGKPSPKKGKPGNKGQIPHNKGKPQPKSQCAYCGIWCAANMMARYHGDNCKHKKEI